MEATGLEKGGLYRHFSSKEELAVAVFPLRSRKRDQNHGQKGLEAYGDPLDQLRYLIRRFVEEPSFMAGGCPLMNTAIDSDDGNAVLRKLALDAIRDWKSRLAVIVTEGIRRREIRRSIDPGRIANTIVATLEGALMISRLEGSKAALHDARKSLEDLLLQIRCAGRAHPPRRMESRNS